MISKYAKIPARALAIMRNPELFDRARGQLHWQDPVAKGERKKISHRGDEAKLKQYMEDNKESLQQEAGKSESRAVEATPTLRFQQPIKTAEAHQKQSFQSPDIQGTTGNKSLQSSVYHPRH